MKKSALRLLLAVSMLLLPRGPAWVCADEVTGVVVTPLTSTTTTASGQRIEVPAHPEVVVSLFELAPGVALPVHKHPYPRYGFVLSGTLEVTVMGGKTYRYKTGDFMAEVIDQWHMGKNVGATPVRLLVIDQVAPGHSNTIIRP